MPEVIGDAGVLFDPRSAAALSAEIKRIIGDKKFRASLVEKGIARNLKFSWANCAKNTVQLYRKL